MGSRWLPTHLHASPGFCPCPAIQPAGLGGEHSHGTAGLVRPQYREDGLGGGDCHCSCCRLRVGQDCDCSTRVDPRRGPRWRTKVEPSRVPFRSTPGPPPLRQDTGNKISLCGEWVSETGTCFAAARLLLLLVRVEKPASWPEWIELGGCSRLERLWRLG